MAYGWLKCRKKSTPQLLGNLFYLRHPGFTLARPFRGYYYEEIIYGLQLTIEIKLDLIIY